MKRLMLALALVWLPVWCGGSAASAASYPSRDIEMIIPMLAGSAGDITGRLLAEELKKELGVGVIVLNKPGGSFTVGTDMVARSKKDGYTIGYVNAPAIVYSRVTEPKSVAYDPQKDLEPLGLHVFFPQAIAVQAKAPWKNIQELIAHAKKNPGALRCANPGQGSVSTFVAELTQDLAGFKVTQVPTKGGQQAPTMLLGGHVELAVGAYSVFAPHVESGNLKILLLSRKLPGFEGVSTLSDLGYKGEAPSGWFSLYGPAGLPEEVKRVLVPAIKKAVEAPSLRPKLEKMFYVVDYRSPGELAKMAKEEYDTVSAIAKRLGIPNE